MKTTYSIAILTLICGVPVVAQEECIDCETPVIGGHSAAGTGLYKFDRQDPWLHGFYQSVPAYGGYGSFRPYNYKHVLPQAAMSQRWGSSRSMPYSHHFYRRYRAEPALVNPDQITSAKGPLTVPIPTPMPHVAARQDVATPVIGGFTLPRTPLSARRMTQRRSEMTVDSKVTPAMRSQVYAPLFPLPAGR